jgi:hypothetical protein
MYNFKFTISMNFTTVKALFNTPTSFSIAPRLKFDSFRSYFARVYSNFSSSLAFINASIPLTGSMQH